LLHIVQIIHATLEQRAAPGRQVGTRGSKIGLKRFAQLSYILNPNGRWDIGGVTLVERIKQLRDLRLPRDNPIRLAPGFEGLPSTKDSQNDHERAYCHGETVSLHESQGSFRKRALPGTDRTTVEE
jgi:hypothetical protein